MAAAHGLYKYYLEGGIFPPLSLSLPLPLPRLPSLLDGPVLSLYLLLGPLSSSPHPLLRLWIALRSSVCRSIMVLAPFDIPRTPSRLCPFLEVETGRE